MTETEKALVDVAEIAAILDLLRGALETVEELRGSVDVLAGEIYNLRRRVHAFEGETNESPPRLTAVPREST